MQISLLTPLFNRLDLTRACVESVRRTLAGWEFEWIFLDDGSTDGTREFLGALAEADPRVRVVLNERGRGFAANNNAGANLARAPLLCLLNNDTVLLPGWLEPMARLARLLPDAACVGNVQREPVSGLVDHAGVYFNREGDARHAGKDEPAPPREDYLEWPAVTAACCVIRREVFLGLGGFDEAFHNGGEDMDFCLRAGTRGYRHFVANRSVIYHYISASPGRKQGEEDNARLFRERWLARLQTDLGGRQTLGQQREAGRRYLRKRAWQPWRYNGWRLLRAMEQAWALRPLSRELDLGPRLWFRAQDFLRERRERRATKPQPVWGGKPVFLVADDTARTVRRAGVPTVVRSLAGACGRTGAPVRLVHWKPEARCLALLPPEMSLGLDAEALRAPLEPGWDEPSAASIFQASAADGREPWTDTPGLHELPGPVGVPTGAWIVLPEVWDRDRLELLVKYVHRHGWRLAVIVYDAMATNEPQFFPWGAAHAHEGYLRAVSGADLVLPVSATAAEHWHLFAEAKELPRPAMRTCAPGVDTCTHARGTAKGARTAGAPVRLLCVSAVTPHKNHRALLAAFDLAVVARPELDLRLTLVGVPSLFNEDNVPAAVRAFVERHPGRVTWIEWVEYSALARLYEAADFTVFPSVLEDWGLPILESLWCGRPCVCANFGAMAQTAAGGGCLTVDVRDAQALADAILSLAESPEPLAALTAQIAGRPLKTWEDYACELLGTLELLDEK